MPNAGPAKLKEVVGRVALIGECGNLRWLKRHEITNHGEQVYVAREANVGVIRNGALASILNARVVIRNASSELLFDAIALLNQHRCISRIHRRQATNEQPDRKLLFPLKTFGKGTHLAVFRWHTTTQEILITLFEIQFARLNTISPYRNRCFPEK